MMQWKIYDIGKDKILMNTAVILAGGVGSRMGADRPKQFLTVKDKPIIAYCLNTFENHDMIDSIVIVVDESWRDYVTEWIKTEKISKFKSFANPGDTRQHSIYNGLKAAEKFTAKDDVVIIHDAARPLTSYEIIKDCLDGARELDGAMPVISVKDTIYQSADGSAIDSLLNRSELFAGQAPEAFNFGKYYDIHNSVTDEEIGLTNGSSEIAYRHGMKIKLVRGSEANFKITTPEDLKSFELIMNNR